MDNDLLSQEVSSTKSKNIDMVYRMIKSQIFQIENLFEEGGDEYLDFYQNYTNVEELQDWLTWRFVESN